MDIGINLFCEVDGVQLQNLDAYRAHSGLFTWGPLPADNIFTAFGVSAPQGTTSPAVQDGFYILLAPLSAGAHTIRFGGNFDGFFGEDVTYHLTVAGSGQAGATPVEQASWGRVKAIYR